LCELALAATASAATQEPPWKEPSTQGSPSTSEWRTKRPSGWSFARRSNSTTCQVCAAMATPSAIKRMARRRAQKRWSALIGGPNLRIARLMRASLGERCLAAFTRHADRHYKPQFIAAFEPDLLPCVGGRDGEPCPHKFVVDLTSTCAYRDLECLHMDHEQDVRVTCDMWQRALPKTPVCWDDGVDGGLLCHLLFSVRASAIHGPPGIRFRCGPAVRGQHDGRYCHVLQLPHYEHGTRSVVCAC